MKYKFNEKIEISTIFSLFYCLHKRPYAFWFSVEAVHFDNQNL